ncbi:MAG: hypothetical protein ACOWWH_02490, partial [Eubacteriaceae bacterium]
KTGIGQSIFELSGVRVSRSNCGLCQIFEVRKSTHKLLTQTNLKNICIKTIIMVFLFKQQLL